LVSIAAVGRDRYSVGYSLPGPQPLPEAMY
jgi:hypothetical protein